MKIYTKSGDQGKTSLFGGKRLNKDNLRIEAYGTIDELNSFVGLLLAALPADLFPDLFSSIQNRLFDIGSHLASDPEKNVLPSNVRVEDVESLEKGMDFMDESLPVLRNFILPGGNNKVALAHVCRTVCRRAERRIVSLAHEEEVENQVLIYLNRLSDFFFVLSRYIGFSEGIEEVKWVPKK